jgi:hypothetical protein
MKEDSSGGDWGLGDDLYKKWPKKIIYKRHDSENKKKIEKKQQIIKTKRQNAEAELFTQRNGFFVLRCVSLNEVIAVSLPWENGGRRREDPFAFCSVWEAQKKGETRGTFWCLQQNWEVESSRKLFYVVLQSAFGGTMAIGTFEHCSVRNARRSDSGFCCKNAQSRVIELFCN